MLVPIESLRKTHSFIENRCNTQQQSNTNKYARENVQY